ncbi:MAG TPA: hypothetical protein VGQ06_13965 [Gemmatimonadales bacterium]|jgi:hypothetical protein|nr:hypothetical protein [Gemmatimonadales bacterium]
MKRATLPAATLAALSLALTLGVFNGEGENTFVNVGSAGPG